MISLERSAPLLTLVLFLVTGGTYTASAQENDPKLITIEAVTLTPAEAASKVADLAEVVAVANAKNPKMKIPSAEKWFVLIGGVTLHNFVQEGLYDNGKFGVTKQLWCWKTGGLVDPLNFAKTYGTIIHEIIHCGQDPIPDDPDPEPAGTSGGGVLLDFLNLAMDCATEANDEMEAYHEQVAALLRLIKGDESNGIGNVSRWIVGLKGSFDFYSDKSCDSIEIADILIEEMESDPNIVDEFFDDIEEARKRIDSLYNWKLGWNIRMIGRCSEWEYIRDNF